MTRNPAIVEFVHDSGIQASFRRLNPEQPARGSELER